jgi:hypothetical protein
MCAIARRASSAAACLVVLAVTAVHSQDPAPPAAPDAAAPPAAPDAAAPQAPNGGGAVLEPETSGLYFSWGITALGAGAAVYAVCRSSRRN